MEKKNLSNERKTSQSAAGKKTTTKKNSGKTAATKKPGKTGATGIIKTTDTAERSVRTGKTGAVGIIRETGKTGSGNGVITHVTSKPLAASKGGKRRLPTILITNDDGISAPGIRNLVEAV